MQTTYAASIENAISEVAVLSIASDKPNQDKGSMNMHRLKLMGLALIAVFAMAAMAASAASAEVAGTLILVLEGEKVSELTYEGTAEPFEKDPPTLEDGAGNTITATKATVVGKFEPEIIEKKEKPADAEKGTAKLDFEGAKKGAVNCHSSEDTGETILVADVLTGYAEEETKAKELEFGLINTITGLKITCGVVKVEVGGKEPKLSGNLGCLVGPNTLLLKEIEPTEKFTILCKQVKGEPEVGKCIKTTASCELLEKSPLLGSLNGTTFTKVGELIHVKGKFNKMVFLDD